MILNRGIIVIFDDSMVLKFGQGLGPKEVSLGKALSVTIQLQVNRNQFIKSHRSNFILVIQYDSYFIYLDERKIGSPEE